MVNRGRQDKRALPGLAVFSFLLGMAAVLLSGSLLYARLGGRGEYQELISLSGMSYDEELLSEAARIPGLRSLSPVLEIPVRLKVDAYEMETVWLAVDLEELSMKAVYAVDTGIGNTPVLLLGENSLAALQDQNGHSLSQTNQKKLLENYENLEIQYCLNTAEASIRENWQPCRVAGILRAPAENIYLPYGQGTMICRENSLNVSVEKVLLTVEGKSNRDRALKYFEVSGN